MLSDVSWETLSNAAWHCMAHLAVQNRQGMGKRSHKFGQIYTNYRKIYTNSGKIWIFFYKYWVVKYWKEDLRVNRSFLAVLLLYRPAFSYRTSTCQFLQHVHIACSAIVPPLWYICPQIERSVYDTAFLTVISTQLEKEESWVECSNVAPELHIALTV